MTNEHIALDATVSNETTAPESGTHEVAEPEIEITRDDARAAARQFLDDGSDRNVGPRMCREAFAAIYEQAYATPVRGETYPEEAWDLALWIHRHMQTEDCLELRVMAQVFGCVSMINDARRGPPVLREAHLDLIRAVAIFRMREQAYWIALGDKEDAAMEARRQLVGETVRAMGAAE